MVHHTWRPWWSGWQCGAEWRSLRYDRRRLYRNTHTGTQSGQILPTRSVVNRGLVTFGRIWNLQKPTSTQNNIILQVYLDINQKFKQSVTVGTSPISDNSYPSCMPSIQYCLLYSNALDHNTAFYFFGFVQYTKWASASFEHTLNKPVISYHNELTRYLRISDGMDEPSVKSQDCQGRNTDCVVDKIMSAWLSYHILYVKVNVNSRFIQHIIAKPLMRCVH